MFLSYVNSLDFSVGVNHVNCSHYMLDALTHSDHVNYIDYITSSSLYCEVETQEERSRLLIAFRRFDNENIQRQAHEYMYSPSHFIIKEGVEEVR
ncbi:unnamed protein product, partial [Adineta steineri]